MDAATTTIPSPPFVSIEGILNFRDLGGYAVSSALDSQSIRRNVIYRCGEPNRVTLDGIAKLRSLGITHAYDLRSTTEIEKNIAAGRGGTVEWDGCERVFAPVFNEKDYSPENIAIRYKDYASEGTEGFTRAYADILSSAPPSYRRILLHIANETDTPLIIHCTAGKDRTGVLCALILSLCGVDDDTIAYEYALTETGLAEMKGTIVEHLLKNPALSGNKAGVLNMRSAKAVNMLATLNMIREKYGGPEAYVTQKCGLTSEDVGKIRSNLVVKEVAINKVLKL